MVRLLLVVNILLGGLVGLVDAASIQTIVSPNEVTVGDPVRYSIILQYNDHEKLNKVPLKLLFSDVPYDVDLVDFKMKKAKVNGNRLLRMDYDLIAFEPGVHAIPTHNIVFLIKGKLRVYTVSDKALTVTSVLPSSNERTAQFKDIAPLVMPSFPVKSALVWSILILAVLGSCLWGVYYWRKQQKINTTVVEEVPTDNRPIEVRYIEQLEKVRDSIAQFQDGCVFYDRVTVILRNYLSERYQSPFLEMTTDETLHALSGVESEQEVRRVKHVLSQGDLVKFAKAAPDESQYLEIIDRCIQVIERTTTKKGSQ